MEIVRLCPFNVALLPWELEPGAFRLTVCVKATFALVHRGEAAVAREQEDVGDERYWDPTPQATLYSPSDFVPFKPHADILLVGHACAPGGQPVESLNVGLRVGDYGKSLQVTGDRVWAAGPGGLQAGPAAPFVEMPLRYERASTRGENLAGVDRGAGTVEAGRPVPNIDATGTRTPGFGALPPAWRARRHHLGEAALAWTQMYLRSPAPAPPGLDYGFFNAAPLDQQIEVLRPGALVVLENLHRELPRLETRLPAVRPRVFRVDPRTGRAAEIAQRCDTLWIDADRELAVLCWRGVTALDDGDPAGVGQIVVMVEACTEPEARREEGDPAPTPARPRAPSPSLPAVSAPPPSLPPGNAPAASPQAPGLPGLSASPGSLHPVSPASLHPVSLAAQTEHTPPHGHDPLTLTVELSARAEAWPFRPAPAAAPPDELPVAGGPAHGPGSLVGLPFKRLDAPPPEPSPPPPPRPPPPRGEPALPRLGEPDPDEIEEVTELRPIASFLEHDEPTTPAGDPAPGGASDP